MDIAMKKHLLSTALVITLGLQLGYGQPVNTASNL